MAGARGGALEADPEEPAQMVRRPRASDAQEHDWTCVRQGHDGGHHNCYIPVHLAQYIH